MKKLYVLFTITALWLYSYSAYSQLNNGGIHAFFGVDGDTKSNYIKYGPSNGFIVSDDWFSFSPAVKNIIDTTNSSFYLAKLQGGANMGFSRRMSVPLYSKLNGRLWLDAVYGRDFVATNPLTDSTAFTIACKNGDNPTNWVGGSTNFPDKNDLVDVFAHMRRDGLNVHDSLWFFTGVSTVGTSGSRYFDIELYKKNFSYSGTDPGTFSTAGTSAGHTEWLFDASGNIIQTGDMIIAVNYSPGSAPVVDLRIWVSSSTYSSVIPAYFKFGPAFDGSSPLFGYASIVANNGSTSFGSGIANYSGTASQDTTYSTPWGTEESSKNWATQYQTLQLIEVGLNLTRIGVDPALYSNVGLSACESLFSNIFFKSRSSNSFSSNMQDFVGPLDFLKYPVMDYSLQPDTLRCNKTLGKINITNNTTIGYYTWTTSTGGIVASSADSSQIDINKPGTYIVSAAPAVGCPVTRKDTVVIPVDNFQPVASITTGTTMDLSHLLFYGGNVAASNFPTPFGGSKGLLWNWSGPGGFTDNIQNTINDTIWGTYQLIVTEKRNGCKDTAVVTLHRSDFFILAPQNFKLSAIGSGESIVLKWDDKNAEQVTSYEIEKSLDGKNFTKIGSVSSSGDLYFSDPQVNSRNNLYRVKSVTKNGVVYYSNIINVISAPNSHQHYSIINSNNSSELAMLCNVSKDYSGTILVVNLNGQVLQKMPVKISKGTSVINIPVRTGLNHEMLLIALQVDNEIVFKKKVLR